MITELWHPKAISKLEAGAKSLTGQKEKIMGPSTMDTLKSFCEQDEEFAQAVVQGGSFQECMTHVAKNTGGAISDIEAFAKAVEFYFPGAKIRVQMCIDLVGDADPAPEEKPRTPVVLNLADFFK